MYFCTLFCERRAVLTPKTKPVKPGFLSAHKPGFLSAHKPGFTGLKMGGLPGFSGTRVSFRVGPTLRAQRLSPLNGSHHNTQQNAEHCDTLTADVTLDIGDRSQFWVTELCSNQINAYFWNYNVHSSNEKIAKHKLFANSLKQQVI